MDQDTSVCRDIFLACNQSDFQLGMWSVDRKMSIRRGGGQESQFYSVFFMQAAIIAYNIGMTKPHSNFSEKEIYLREV